MSQALFKVAGSSMVYHGVSSQNQKFLFFVVLCISKLSMPLHVVVGNFLLSGYIFPIVYSPVVSHCTT